MAKAGLIFKLDDREFDRVLKEYVQYSRRTLPVIVNTKAYYIARRAVAETPKADRADIANFIGWDGGRIAGMLINKRRGERGEKGLQGAAMKKAVMAMKAGRLRALGFIKSGWIPAIKLLAPYAEAIRGPRTGRLPRTTGVPKGSAIPATQAWRVKAQIQNTVTAAWDKRSGAQKVAVPALQRAFDAERQSMLDYMARKMKEGAKKLGIKVG